MIRVTIILVLLLSLCGCVTEKVNTVLDDTLPVNLYSKAKDKGLEIKPVPKSPAELCFERFKIACQAGAWARAYDELSVRWRQSVSLTQFEKNMAQVGYKHLEGVHVISIARVQKQEGEKVMLTTVNKDGNRAVFLLVPENQLWKIAGVKNMTKEQS